MFSIVCWVLIGRRILYSIVPSVNKKDDNYDGVVVRELAQFKTNAIQIGSTFMPNLSEQSILQAYPLCSQF